LIDFLFSFAEVLDSFTFKAGSKQAKASWRAIFTLYSTTAFAIYFKHTPFRFPLFEHLRFLVLISEVLDMYSLKECFD